jgi:hypothetical protein
MDTFRPIVIRPRLESYGSRERAWSRPAFRAISYYSGRARSTRNRVKGGGALHGSRN